MVVRYGKLKEFCFPFCYAVSISTCRCVLTLFLREGHRERENVRLGKCGEWQRVLKVPKGNITSKNLER